MLNITVGNTWWDYVKIGLIAVMAILSFLYLRIQFSDYEDGRDVYEAKEKLLMDSLYQERKIKDSLMHELKLDTTGLATAKQQLDFWRAIYKSTNNKLIEYERTKNLIDARPVGVSGQRIDESRNRLEKAGIPTRIQ